MTLTEAVKVLSRHRHRSCAAWRLIQYASPFGLRVEGIDSSDWLSPLEAIAVAKALQAGHTEERTLAEVQAEPAVVRLPAEQAAAQARHEKATAWWQERERRRAAEREAEGVG